MRIDVTDVERLSLRPGDRLVVHIEQQIAAGDVDRIRELVRGALMLPADIPILVTGPGVSVSVVTP